MPVAIAGAALTSIAAQINKLITEHGSAEVLAKHLAFIRDQAQSLEKENVDLKKRVSELEELTRKLTGELQAKAVGEEFIKHRGVLFRKFPAGGYEDSAYCPHCKGPMFSLMGATPFKCTRCSFVAGFTGTELKTKVLAELVKNYG